VLEEAHGHEEEGRDDGQREQVLGEDLVRDVQVDLLKTKKLLRHIKLAYYDVMD
jgi:hypothetical protein